MEFSQKSLKTQGFSGWIPFSAIRSSDCPEQGGVYVITYDSPGPVAFAPRSRGGWFKGKDPSVSVQVLHAIWVEGTEVVYIGKGDQLRRRLQQFADFGTGKPIGHWGGRLIWQLEIAEALRVAWKPTPDKVPVQVESDMIAAFRREFGKPPFANAPHLLGR